MTPLIGFRPDAQKNAGGPLVLIPPVAVTGTGAAHSPVADYAYRIAALTAGLALLVTFV